MSFVSASVNQGATSDGASFNRAGGYITDIISLLELTAQLRFISEMNFSILRDEFVGLRTLIEGRDRANNPVTDVSFPPAFFSAGLPEPRLQSRSQRAPRETKEAPDPAPAAVSRAGIDESESEAPEIPQPIAPSASASPDVRSERPAYPAQAPQQTVQAPRPAEQLSRGDGKSIRKESIIKFLRSRGGVSIKDIAAVIPDCSEKTVQRELIELMDAGIVVRSGERRWSTYSLAS